METNQRPQLEIETPALYLSEELLRKIDEQRGKKSRAEFIDSCIDEFLTERGFPTARYATRKELEDLKERVTRLQKSFMEFILTYIIDLGK